LPDAKGFKEQRKNKAQQQRDAKKEDARIQKRIGSVHGPPKTIGIVGLGANANVKAVSAGLLSLAQKVTSAGDANGKFGATTTACYEQLGQRFVIHECTRDALAIMDMAKVADIMVLVVACRDGEDETVDAVGEAVIRGFRSQGMPSVIGVMQGLTQLKNKEANSMRKWCGRFFTQEFYEDAKLVEDGKPQIMLRTLSTCAVRSMNFRAMRSYMLVQNAEVVAPQAGEEANPAGHATLKLSGYLRGQPLCVNGLVHITGTGTFQLQQVTEANEGPESDPARLGKKRHGAAPAAAVTVLAAMDPAKAEPLTMEAVPDPMMGEQTWPTEDEMAGAGGEGAGAAGGAPGKKKKMKPKGMSDYQAAWMLSDSESGSDDEEEGGDGDFPQLGGGDDAMGGMAAGGMDGYNGISMADIKSMAKQRKKEAGEAVSSDEDVGSGSDVEEDEDWIPVGVDKDGKGDGAADDVGAEVQMSRAEWLAKQATQRAADEDEDCEFPDEVEAPDDGTKAHVRYARYRGLKSFRTSDWDPKESLPEDYGRIWQFRNFMRHQRMHTANLLEVEKGLMLKMREERLALGGNGGAGNGGGAAAGGAAAGGMDDEMQEALAEAGIDPEDDRFEGFVGTGRYVTLYVKAVPVDVAVDTAGVPAEGCARVRASRGWPLVLSSLLPHENKLSVVNMMVQKSSNLFDPVRSKDPLVVHVGFRRFSSRPMFTQNNLNCNKNKFDRWLQQKGFHIATAYLPVTCVFVCLGVVCLCFSSAC
jgi:pre-rRNA-processing protein TSR1